jgi:hypothetical protein
VTGVLSFAKGKRTIMEEVEKENQQSTGAFSMGLISEKGKYRSR